MSKLTNNLKRDFSQVPNDLVNDESMTPQARFLFILLASQKDGFTLWQTWILKKTGWKDRATLTKYWNEIQAKGWGVRTRKVGSNGKMGTYDYELFATPKTTVEKTRSGDGEPVREISTVDKNHSGKNPHYNNTNLQQHELNNNTSLGFAPKNERAQVKEDTPTPPKATQPKKKVAAKKKGPSFDVPDKYAVGAEVYRYLQTRPNFASFVEPKHQATYIAIEFIAHYEESGWKKSRGGYLQSWELAAQRWVRGCEKKRELLRTPPNHPDYAKPKWAKDQQSPERLNRSVFKKPAAELPSIVGDVAKRLKAS